MNVNQIGNTGEAAALKFFIESEYEVYLPFGTASSIDMIIIDKYNGQSLKRVSVKSTSKKAKSGKYEVDIRQNTRSGCIPIDKGSFDLLFLYVVPEDRFVVLNTEDIKNKTTITI